MLFELVISSGILSSVKFYADSECIKYKSELLLWKPGAHLLLGSSLPTCLSPWLQRLSIEPRASGHWLNSSQGNELRLGEAGTYSGSYTDWWKSWGFWTPIQECLSFYHHDHKWLGPNHKCANTTMKKSSLRMVGVKVNNRQKSICVKIQEAPGLLSSGSIHRLLFLWRQIWPYS